MLGTTTPTFAPFSVEQHAQLLASLGHAVIATDERGLIRFWNRAAEELYGWTADEVMGRDVTSVTPGPASEHEAQAIMQTLLRGESWRGAFEVRRKDGTTFLADVTDTPVFDEQKNLIGIVGVSLDLSAQRRAEERARFLADAARVLALPLELHETLTQLAQLSVPVFGDLSVVYRVGDDGMAHRVASAHVDPARRHLIEDLERDYPVSVDGSAPVPHVLRSHQPLFLPEVHVRDLDVPDERYREIAKALDVCSLVVVPLLARGRVRGALVLATVSTRAGGSGRRFVEDDARIAESLGTLGALALDNVLLLRDAERARGQAEEANRAKSAFLAAMSHELRTPLNAIGGYVELLEMELRGPVTDAQRVDLARIRRSQQHLTGLIDNVLNFVRAETGHLQFRIENVSLASVFRDVEDLVLPQLRTKGLRFSREHVDDALKVRADSERLRQILVNLLTNALKYTPAGGEIALSVSDRRDAVLVRVRDSGIGIPADMLEAVFEPFVQVGQPSTAVSEGIGLGLAISRDFARRMGGDISVESETGVGSTFTVRLTKPSGFGA